MLLLDKHLREKLAAKLPSCPQQSYWQMVGMDSHQRDERMEKMQEYLTELSKRTDVRTNQVFRKFMGIQEKIAPRSVVGEIKQLGGLIGMDVEVKDVQVCPELALVFIAVNKVKQKKAGVTSFVSLSPS